MIYVGIDVGGTGIQVGLVDESGKILCKGGIVTRTDIPFDMQVKAMADCVLDTIDKGGYTLGDVKVIGAGVPGVTDPRTGNIAFCTNLGWVDVPFVQEFNKHIAKPVFVGNDATVAGLAESVAGVSAGSDSSVFITLGTGVGGGIVFNGKVWNGFHGVGSEIGHMILELDGEPCTCGNYGCVERYCSATAIIRMARELCAVHPESEIVKVCEGDLNRVNAKVVFDAAKNGDEIALKVFHRYVKYLGQLVASLVNCIDPEVIVLGGGVSKAGDFLLDAVRAEARRYVLYKTLPSARIELAKLGPDAGIIGRKAHDAAQQGAVGAVAVVGLGKGTVEGKVHPLQRRGDHLLCQKGDDLRTCGVGAGRADHVRAQNIKNTDKCHGVSLLSGQEPRAAHQTLALLLLMNFW